MIILGDQVLMNLKSNFVIAINSRKKRKKIYNDIKWSIVDCKCNFAIIIRSLFCMQITFFMVFWIYLFGLFEFWTWVAFENVVNLFCGYVLTQIISPFILWRKRAINQLANQCNSRKKATVQSIHCHCNLQIDTQFSNTTPN